MNFLVMDGSCGWKMVSRDIRLPWTNLVRIENKGKKEKRESRERNIRSREEKKLGDKG